MNTTEQSRSSLESGKPHGFEALLRQARQLSVQPLWQSIGAVVTAFGLLVVFHHVVSGAVEQAKLRHQAFAVQHDTDWRCKPGRGLSDRTPCIEHAVLPQPRETAQVAKRVND